ncbi:MAG: RNA polymerase sigma factor [[Clostridium] fimetarium]|nr:RNA polymerase sigma factor [Alistipes timonensis]MCM1405665.1 RNA polymerase sigma factor [[Clostridium] fimetarium]
MNRLEEIKLLAQCMASDNRDAFSRLLEAYADSLRGFLLNLTNGDSMLADDLAQDTFIKAWQGIRSFRGLSGFKTWLFRIAINEYLSYRRRPGSTGSYSIDDAPGRFAADVSTPHDDSDARHDARMALDSLPPTERAVAVLFYLEDLPIKKICQLTEMPEGTVKSHLSRARDHMARFLKKDNYEI